MVEEIDQPTALIGRTRNGTHHSCSWDPFPSMVAGRAGRRRQRCQHRPPPHHLHAAQLYRDRYRRIAAFPANKPGHRSQSKLQFSPPNSAAQDRHSGQQRPSHPTSLFESARRIRYVDGACAQARRSRLPAFGPGAIRPVPGFTAGCPDSSPAANRHVWLLRRNCILRDLSRRGRAGSGWKAKSAGVFDLTYGRSCGRRAVKSAREERKMRVCGDWCGPTRWRRGHIVTLCASTWTKHKRGYIHRAKHEAAPTD